MALGIVILIICIIGLFFLFALAGQENEKNDGIHKNKIESILEGYNFTNSKSFSSSDKTNNIFYDDNKKEILIIIKEENSIDKKAELYKKEKIDNPNTSLREFDFSFNTTLISNKDIIECGLFEDDSSITKTSRGSQVAGAVIGGALVGGVGAVIGGLSGKKTTTGATKKIELRITVDNPLNPIVRFRFLDEKSPVKKDSKRYEDTMNEAIHWQNLFTVLIHRLEKEAK